MKSSLVFVASVATAVAISTAGGRVSVSAQSSTVSIPFRIQNRLVTSCPAQASGNGDPTSGVGPIHWEGNVPINAECVGNQGDNHGYRIDIAVFYRINGYPDCHLWDTGIVDRHGDFDSYENELGQQSLLIDGDGCPAEFYDQEVNAVAPLLAMPLTPNASWCPSSGNSITYVRSTYDFAITAKRSGQVATATGPTYNVVLDGSQPWFWHGNNEYLRARDRTCEVPNGLRWPLDPGCVAKCGPDWRLQYVNGYKDLGPGVGLLPDVLPTENVVFSYRSSQ